mgnify:CR=1 FL=1
MAVVTAKACVKPQSVLIFVPLIIHLILLRSFCNCVNVATTNLDKVERREIQMKHRWLNRVPAQTVLSKSYKFISQRKQEERVGSKQCSIYCMKKL